ACQEVKQWHDNGYPTLKIAINLAARHFEDELLTNDLSIMLKESGINPKNVEIELTEGTLIEGSQKVINTLNEIKKLGVSIAIDDFGTGYSSLTYLKKFPVDKLKIDRTFIHDILTNEKNKALVKAIIAMANSLEIKILAEGIETEAQLKILKELGCKLGQGFFYSKPIPYRQALQYI